MNVSVDALILFPVVPATDSMEVIIKPPAVALTVTLPVVLDEPGSLKPVVGVELVNRLLSTV